MSSFNLNLRTMMHGKHAANVYDLNGQNICISDCLEVEPESDDIRTLIFESSGTLKDHWQYSGSRFL